MVPPGETRPDTELLARILELAGLEMILIGGQALYGLVEKQDEHGIAQLRLAIAVVREFLKDMASREGERQDAGERPVSLRHLRRIETLALSDAGRKIAKRYDIHVADAIDPIPLLHIRSFKAKKLPQLLRLMSRERQSELTSATR